ncbi:uncharacterized protein TOT_010001095 [Theileria orientalis strain Shintoku]|uniref:Uncharacterized protein n=1 Tax=Theileria orientalis strain Shintoku TaxID=869250 RepID=J4C313_THEOR|nr:uncharacterized protein TOT_010001095 [Theileria orientalis strain Shintoku]BAM39641.1 uncharacterized protein TOT_010001095 [Theileria orientalis strain Shintoku]|eukprot:XP_009689942.1 uncharacterized protein TOT_010001095 [Theileria orientalis strain Shintoku]
MATVANPQTPQNQTTNRPARQTSKQCALNKNALDWIIQLIFQLIMIRIIYSLFMNSRSNVSTNKRVVFTKFRSYFEEGEVFDIYGVVTSDVRIDFENLDSSQLVYVNENKTYKYKFNSPYEAKKVTIRPSSKFLKDIRENLYLTVFIIPHKSYLFKASLFYKSKFKEGFQGHYIVKTIPLTKVKRVKKKETVHLINTKNSKEEEEGREKKFFIPRLDINLVYELKELAQVRNDVYFDQYTKHHQQRLYDPLLHLSQFWVLEEHLVPIESAVNPDAPEKEMNVSLAELLKEADKKLFIDDLVVGTVGSKGSSGGESPLRKEETEGTTEDQVHAPGVERTSGQESELDGYYEGEGEGAGTDGGEYEGEGPRELELVVNYSTCSSVYFMLVNNMNTNSSSLWGLDNAKEIETLKKTLMNTNVYYLVFSMLFILLHTVFSAFALKNDIQFWYNNKSMEGLSTITLVVNFVSEYSIVLAVITILQIVIIALYIYDNEKRSFIIMFEILLSVASSFWKLTKAIKIKFIPSYPFFQISSEMTKVEDETREYDKVAIKYMSIILAPCIVGYAIYSLFYKKHKSWYSYIISVLAGSVYTFGFIMMTPQLYINYKLKSVEHLPWRALVYKSLNTFVDDVASFLIEMPMLHRLSCFRDDIIFFCYLYQRWKYKVDPSRNKRGNKIEEKKETPRVEDATEESEKEESENVTRLKEDPKLKG